MFNQFGRLADWIVDHRWMTSAILLCMTVFAAIGHYDPYIVLPQPTAKGKESAEEQSSNSRPKKQEKMPDVLPVNISGGDVIVVADSDFFFTPDGADAIRSAVQAIEDLPHVTNVMWMDRAPMMNIFGLAEPILPRRNASSVRFDAAKKRAVEHPLVVGQLLSDDAKTMLLLVSIDWLFVQSDDDCMDRIRDTAATAAAEFPDAPIQFRVTGDVPVRLSFAKSNRENEIRYQLIGYSIALVIAYILFRGISPVLIVGLAPVAGCFWTLGVFHYTGWSDNPFNGTIVPILLCMVGFTDGVHMMVQIRKHRASGLSAGDAARKSIREVGLACWLTSFTTAVGFGSLVLAENEKVQEFGYCCVVGVLLTFAAVITVIPLLCASPLGARVHIGYGKNLVDKNLERVSGIIDFVLRHNRVLGWTGIIATTVLAGITMLLSPDQRLTSNLYASSEPVTALETIDKKIGGMETSHIEINFPDVAADDPEIVTVVGNVESILRDEELIGHPLSIHSLLGALPGDGDPQTRISMLDLLPPELKRAYFLPERRRAKVVFRLQDIGISSYGPVFERVEEKLAQLERQHPQFTMTLQGNAVWRWKHLYQIVVDLTFSLGTAVVIIFGVLSFVYRSLRIGLLSIIPNLFPLAATGALLYFTGEHLEIVSVCAFTVCLGIAVDDTIHFLTRYCEEVPKQSDRETAIRQAFVGVGTALIMTTVVLVIGFSSALFTDQRDVRIFATMGILTIGCALFADLVFLPALLLRYAPSNGHPMKPVD